MTDASVISEAVVTGVNEVAVEGAAAGKTGYYTYQTIAADLESGTTYAYQVVNGEIVTFHHSIYSVASHAVEQAILTRRDQLVPIFDELGNLFLCRSGDRKPDM